LRERFHFLLYFWFSFLQLGIWHGTSWQLSVYKTSDSEYNSMGLIFGAVCFNSRKLNVYRFVIISSFCLVFGVEQ
jgi:hypothetical protein